MDFKKNGNGQLVTKKPVVGDMIGDLCMKPWGFFNKYSNGQKCTVKIITVNKGQRLSLQSHKFRDELWVAIDEFYAQVGDKVLIINKGEKIMIPRGTKHRIIGNFFLDETRVLEISFGKFRENDIKRYEDDYGRVDTNCKDLPAVGASSDSNDLNNNSTGSDGGGGSGEIREKDLSGIKKVADQFSLSEKTPEICGDQDDLS